MNKTDTFYTDRYLENKSFRLWLNRYGTIIVILILLNWFWEGIPVWLEIFEKLNVAIWLLVASQIIYRHILIRALLFTLGFLSLAICFYRIGLWL